MWVLNGHSLIVRVNPMMFPKGCNRRAISYVEMKGVPEGRDIMTVAVRKVCDS